MGVVKKRYKGWLVRRGAGSYALTLMDPDNPRNKLEIHPSHGIFQEILETLPSALKGAKNTFSYAITFEPLTNIPNYAFKRKGDEVIPQELAASLGVGEA